MSKQARNISKQVTTAENNGINDNAIDPTDLLNNAYPPADGGQDDDFQITRGELEQLQDALKKKEFCKLLTDYVEEIRDPANQLTFQSELRELEKQRGNTVHFLNPIGGYVLKTSINGKKKCFINMCSNALIKKPTFTTATQDNKVGQIWSIPHSPSIARNDVDKAGVACTVYDVVFHPEALKLAKQNFNLKLKLEDTAIEAIEKSFNVKLDRNNIRRPKQKYKGMKNATMIKYKTGEALPNIIDAEQLDKETPPQKDNENLVQNLPKKGGKKISPEKDRKEESKLKGATSVTSTAKNDLNQETKNPEKEQSHEKNNSKKASKAASSEKKEWTEPHYSLKFRNHIDMQDFCLDTQKLGRHVKPIPEEIILTVDLPLLRDSSNLEADVLEGGWDFDLKSKGKILYKLHLKLPFQVHHTEPKATFDKDTRKLTITMTTIPKPTEQVIIANPKISSIVAAESEDGSGDSGVELLENKPTKVEMLESELNEEGRHKKGIDVVHPRSLLCKPSISLDSVGSVGSYELSRSSSFADYDTEDSAVTNFGSPSTKKTVRFSDEVQRQVYRSNSSILGQRKKNQRKARNKKKSRERLNSGESVSSLSVDEEEDVFDMGGSGGGKAKARERFNSGGSISSIDEEFLASGNGCEKQDADELQEEEVVNEY